jgi:hypothetical protein
MKLDTPALPTFVFEATENLSVSAKVRWYMCTIVNLSALNFPDVIPQVYENFAERLLKTLPVEERLKAVQKVREGLIKSVGIAGAARTGTAMRTLANCMPADFQEVESPRSQEPEDVAQERGRKFWANVYARNAAFDPKATERASPDYTFIIRGTFLCNGLELPRYSYGIQIFFTVESFLMMAFSILSTRVMLWWQAYMVWTVQSNSSII